MDKEQEEAAIKLQSMARCRKARKRVKSKKDEARTVKAKREFAAQHIQAVSRGKLERRSITVRKAERINAARMIQARERGRQKHRAFHAKTHGGRVLTDGDLRKGLSQLGRSSFTLHATYLHFSAARLFIRAIDAITRLTWVETVDLSDNFISNLSPLASLPFLTHLHVQHNHVHQLLQYHPPQCGEAKRWNAGDTCVGSVLQTADLSYNRLAFMSNITHHRFLSTLELSHNQIREISGLDQLRCLRVLSLSHNQLERISGLDDLPLMELHLDDNQLRKIENLESLQRLQWLNLNGNQIAHLSGLAGCARLTFLDVGHNCISKVTEVERLMDLNMLRELVLLGNPVNTADKVEDHSKPLFYRLRVLVRLRRLTSLDNSICTAEEKIKAVNVHAVDTSDLPHREIMFAKFYEGEAFTNTIPPFVDDERVDVLEGEAPPPAAKAEAPTEGPQGPAGPPPIPVIKDGLTEQSADTPGMTAVTADYWSSGGEAGMEVKPGDGPGS